MAGLCAGLTEAFVINPFEVVKVRLQTDQSHASLVIFFEQITIPILFNNNIKYKSKKALSQLQG
jgi:hypothetical protein